MKLHSEDFELPTARENRPHRTFDVKSPVLGVALHHRVTAKRNPFDRESHNDTGTQSQWIIETLLGGRVLFMSKLLF
jgi:hypothetical protein